MSFKDNYKDYEEKVVPDSDFLKSLGDDMNSGKKSNIQLHRRKVITRVSASCACLAICAVALSVVLPKQADISLKGNDGGSSLQMSEGMFGSGSWYGDAATPTEIYAAFTQKLDGKLSKLYISDDEKFTDDEIASEEALAEATDRLKNAAECIASGERANPVYYMAVLTGGDVIKFSVYDGKYVEINGVDGCFEIKN